MKHCRVQFSLNLVVNIRFFRQKEINLKPQRQLTEKSIAVSTIGDMSRFPTGVWHYWKIDGIDSVK